MSGRSFWTTLESPVGTLLLVGDGNALSGVRLRAVAPPEDAEHAPDAFEEAEIQLGEYFGGRRTGFDLGLDPVGTPFQLRVWSELRKVGFGETLGYAELARRIGRPTAARAVGAANGANPLSIIVPCHRLVGANGDLTGYSGGLEAKRRLLELEANRSRISSSVV